jgi:hypothetical protein
MSDHEENVDLTHEVDLKNLADRLLIPAVERTRGALWVTKAVVIIFGVTIFLMVIGSFWLEAWWSRIPPPENAIKLVREAAIPFLEKIGAIAATVFGPLLAFIFGFYFGERSDSR